MLRTRNNMWMNEPITRPILKVRFCTQLRRRVPRKLFGSGVIVMFIYLLWNTRVLLNIFTLVFSSSFNYWTMNSIYSKLKKPYDFVVEKLHFRSATQKEVSSPTLSSKRANVLSSILSPFETYVVTFQSLLIWERPFLSAAAFVSINIIYW